MVMRAAARIVARAPAPAVEIVRATCSVCHSPRALCATLRDTEPTFCFTCSLSMAQLIASQERENKRPHKRPCHCEGCVTFDEGQRGEIANAELVDSDSGERLSRWRLLEVDDR